MAALFYLVPRKSDQKPNGTWRQRLGLVRRYWWNRSAKVDYQLMAINALLKAIIFVPFLSFGFQISQFTVHGLLNLFGDFQSLPPSQGSIALFTLAVFVWDDFLRFFHHFLMHRFSWLWAFHEAHHSARVLTPLTLFRTHPVEAFLAALRNGLSLGVATGAFLFLFDGHFHVLTFLGVNAFGWLFNFLGSNLRHSQVPLGFGHLERVFISPAQHQIHHSQAATDFERNFGVSLAIWDLLFGTHAFSSRRRQPTGHGPMRFGVSGPYNGKILHIVFGPFLKILSMKFQVLSILLKPWTDRRECGQMLNVFSKFRIRNRVSGESIK